MLVVGLTGGIGSGKSTVSALLAARGAVIIDADAIVHEVQAPGGVAFQPIVDRFGPGVVTAEGALDRPAIAAIVFNDPAALADLNAITHPIVGQVIFDRMAAQAETQNVVVLDVPLLVESGRDNTAGVIVVDCPVEEAVARAVARGPASESDVRARIAAQATREERLAKADFVIDNSGDRAHLEAEVDKAWAWVQSLAG
ncbi:MAG: dephospho-CoA kinase [Actinobacteria bacterium]|nr:dephospho-CoA kinase [Actinomycetota bacterium]MBV9255779.1 dephospho-CoA kinase [Actinomycetota bacterium]MBV9663338.1 dephospho-CoA kinase [Actinomycetota bacterium]MBV9934551.1 dephospho-CoA kinase [Actinomycetota bacterium]